jgi:Zn-dependent protease
MLFGNLPASQVAGLAIALVAGITFHEFMHAFVADQLGDHRARALGRVSLNPIRHIDPMGALFFLIAGFGWGKPTPVNPSALRPGRIGMAYVAAGGPLANLLLASIVAVAVRSTELAGFSAPGDFLWETLWWVVFYNVILGLFNLLPIPPLDGYNLVLPFLPARTAMQIHQYATYGVLVLLALILLPRLGGGPNPLSWIFDVAGAITQALTGA